jgi:hypothetical protein
MSWGDVFKFAVKTGVETAAARSVAKSQLSGQARLLNAQAALVEKQTLLERIYANPPSAAKTTAAVASGAAMTTCAAMPYAGGPDIGIGWVTGAGVTIAIVWAWLWNRRK